MVNYISKILQIYIFSYHQPRIIIIIMTDLEYGYVRSGVIPFGLILVANVCGYLHVLPVFLQLLVNSCSVVYLGTILSQKIGKSKNGEMTLSEKEKGAEEIGKKEAFRFPIVASLFLLGFYLVYKYVNKDIVNVLITLQFCLATVISTSGMIQPYIPFPDPLKKVLAHVKPYKFIKSLLEIDDFDVSPASIITSVICSIPVVAFYLTKHWILNNIYGILFSIVALRNIHLSNFQVGFILLWLLFFYDIFWVYGTDVMVTVARNLDIPIKLLFPYLNDEGEEKFSMLGLGDIVIPGIFIGLCLKFDIDQVLLKSKPKAFSDFTIPYFNTSYIGYIAGIVLTFAAMYIFDHAQPALLYLVPTCTLSVLALSFIRNEFQTALTYNSPDEEEQKPEQKSEQKVEEEKEPLKKEETEDKDKNQ